MNVATGANGGSGIVIVRYPTGAARTVVTAPPSIPWHSAMFADDADWLRPADGAPVGATRDLSGNNRPMRQGTSGSRPTFRDSTTALNNKASIEFDGTNDYMSTEAWSALSQPYSMVLIFEVLAVPASFATFLSGRLSSGTAQLFAMDSSGRKWGLGGSSNQLVGSSVTTGAHAMRGKIHSNTDNDMTIDGTLATGSGNLGADLCNGMRLGANSGSISFANIRVAFAGIYNGDVAAHANWSAFCSWALSTYGVTLA